MHCVAYGGGGLLEACADATGGRRRGNAALSHSPRTFSELTVRVEPVGISGHSACRGADHHGDGAVAQQPDQRQDLSKVQQWLCEASQQQD